LPSIWKLDLIEEESPYLSLGTYALAIYGNLASIFCAFYELENLVPSWKPLNEVQYANLAKRPFLV